MDQRLYKKLSQFIFFSIFIFSSKLFANEESSQIENSTVTPTDERLFQLNPGTMSFGGSFSHTTNISRMGVVKNTLDLRTEGSYFFLKNFETGLKFEMGGLLHSNDSQGRKLPRLETKFGISLKYYYWVIDRYGLSFGSSYLFTAQNTADAWRNYVEINLGCLFPLTSNIALDLSLPFLFAFAPTLFDYAEFPRVSLGLKVIF